MNNNNKKYNMNTPLFVSLLHLGDDKKISLNKSKNIKSISKNNSINLAMKDYLELLIKDINERKEEIYSNKTPHF